MVNAYGGPGTATLEWETATDADSPPVVYLAYHHDSESGLWDQTPIELDASYHSQTFNGIAPGYHWVGVRARDSATPANIEKNDNYWGIIVE